MGEKTQPQYQDQSGMFKSPYHEDNTVAVLGNSKKSESKDFSIGSRFSFLKSESNNWQVASISKTTESKNQQL